MAKSRAKTTKKPEQKKVVTKTKPKKKEAPTAKVAKVSKEPEQPLYMVFLANKGSIIDAWTVQGEGPHTDPKFQALLEDANGRNLVLTWKRVSPVPLGNILEQLGDHIQSSPDPEEEEELDEDDDDEDDDRVFLSSGRFLDADDEDDDEDDSYDPYDGDDDA